MRISDWSSDVCSSDLLQRQRRRPDHQVVDRQLEVVAALVVQLLAHRQQRIDLAVDGQVEMRRELLRLEIGRESCRDRLCQYVSILVVAVSLNNKTYDNKRTIGEFTRTQSNNRS